MDEDIPLPVDLPAAALKQAHCRVSEQQMAAFQVWPRGPGKSGTAEIHPIRPPCVIVNGRFGVSAISSDRDDVRAL